MRLLIVAALKMLVLTSVAAAQFGDVYGSAAACDHYLRGGIPSVVAAPEEERDDFIIIAPDGMAGAGWHCSRLPNSRWGDQVKCRTDHDTFELTARISRTGTNTISVSIGDRRLVLRSCELSSTTAKFLQFPLAGRLAIVYAGPIEAGDYDEFLGALERIRPDTVIIDSPGGDVREAMRIGIEIHNRSLNTFVRAGHECASACALVFFAGTQKFLSRTATIGLHMARSGDGRPSAEGTMLMEGYLLAMGVPQDLLTAMYDYGPDDMLWLSESERKTLKIINLWP